MDLYLRRIWKYKFHYLLAFLPLMVILLLKIVPFLIGVRMAFVNFNPFYGLFGSEWAGWANFEGLFNTPEFGNILTNTLAIKLSYMAVVGTVSLVLAVALSGIQSARLRNTFVLLFLIPYFIPSSVFADVAAFLLSPSQSVFPIANSPLADPAYFRAVVYLLETLKTCGIPVLLALAAIRAYSSGSRAFGVRQIPPFYPALRALVAFLLIQLSTILSTDFELLHRLINPIVFSVSDTVDTFGFRIGFMNAHYGVGSAMWLFQFAVQLIFTLAAYFLVRKWFFHDLFTGSSAQASGAIRLNLDKSTGSSSGSSAGRNALGIVVASLYSALVLLFLYFLFVHPFLHGEGGGPALSDVFPARNFILFLFFYGMVTVIGLLIILMLAYPLTATALPGRRLYKLVLLFVLAIGTGSTLHEYMAYRQIGAVNTILPLLISGLVAIVGVFVLKGVFNANYASLKLQAEQEGRGEMHAFFTLFVPKVWKSLLGLGVLNFGALWNSYIPSLVYLSNPKLYSPVAAVTMLSRGMDLQQYPEIWLQLGAIVSLPPVILLLALSRFLTSEVFLGASRRF
ncbi:hypothetical protein [Cohnella sp.]|uniref:hypothetical protein n=1 Tax=Cohnella sp. TaxID=1883426 RepID=UPI003565AD9F